MGDAQSAQREANKDAAAAAAEEEDGSGRVDDAQTEHTIEDKTHGQIAEINGKIDESIAEVNGHCEDEIAAEAILLPDEDVSGTDKPLKEEKTLCENVELNKKESTNDGDANDNVPQEIIEVDAKQNDINEGFRKFFSNIGLKLTVKRGSRDIATDMPDKTKKDEPNKPEDVEDTTKETKSENAEQITDVNITQEAYDNDSTTCPTLTDVTSEDVLENAEEKTTETKEEVESDNADAAMASPVEDPMQDGTPEEEPHSTSPTSPEEDAVVSPIKRFFTTGIFSGLRKKKKPADDEITEKELVDMGKKEVLEKTEQTVKDQQQDEGEISVGTEAVAVEDENKENELKEEILPAASAQTTDEGKSASRDASTIMSEPEILSSGQEKDKVQASPLKRLLSGSSLKKLSKKQKDRKSSDGTLCVSGEQVSDQLLLSTESAENQKGEGPAQPSAEAAEEEDSAWVSFKKLVTPKKRMKRSSLSNEDTQIPGLVEEPKPSEGEQISDHSTEEGKKRKDSSVSWEAVLCGSGRRRSRKTSDSEEETPEIDNTDHKQDGGPKHGAESPLESSNENEILASSPKQASEGDGESTWKSLKRLVTPKRKAKDEDESKDQIQSDNEVIQDESSFSIKKLLPGRKKRKSVEHQDQVSSEEADKDVDSGHEDSETPAVVPLSEFDVVETEVHIQTQAGIESDIPKEENYELQQDLLDQMAEPVKLKTEANKVEDDDVLEKQAFTTPATNEEPDDLTESIGKHQQLSDIPEEGIITETMATPASADEEAARDDTIAEDLIEITSEAITAPEPAADITIADETEMISAVSQLSSESSKTSGNTTPVPAEHNVVETDMLLYQAVESISISPTAVPVSSDESSPEKIVGSVSHQILETFVKEEPKVLEMHTRVDETAINTGLNVEELDAINERPATYPTESISEVNDFGSTEIVSEVPTEEFDTAEIDVDEIQEVSITHQDESIKELESIDESHHLVEPEINTAAYPDKLPQGNDIVPDASSVVETHQAVTEPPQIDSQVIDSVAAVADESKDGAKEQEVQTVTGEEDYATDQIQVENKDQPTVEMEELHKLAQEQAATLDSEGTFHSLEKEVISEDIPAAKTITCERKEETVPLTVEPEKEDELQTDETKTDHVQVPEELEAVQASTLDSQESSVQVPQEEAKSEDIPQGETITEESKQKVELPTEVIVEPENKELPVTAESQHVQEEEVLQAVQAEEVGSVQSLDKEVISKTDTVTDELKEETILVTEDTLDASKSGHDQVPELIQAVQAEGVGSVQSLDKEVISKTDTVTDELKEETILVIEDTLDASKSGHGQVPELIQAVQAEEVGSVQSLEKEAISKTDTVTDELKEEPILVTEVTLEPVDASKTGHGQEPDVIQAVPASTLNSEEVSVQSLQKEVKLEDVPEAETVTDGLKEETMLLPEVDASKTEDIQESEVLQIAQAPTLASEVDSLLSLEKELTSEDIPTVETVTDEPKQENEFKVEPEEKLQVDAAKTEHVQEPEALTSDVKDIVTETKTEEETLIKVKHEVTEGIEEDSPQEFEKGETESEVVGNLDQTLEITEDQKSESIPQDVQVEQEDDIPEVVDELQTLREVHVSSINEEAINVQVLEKAVSYEDTSAPYVDNAAVTEESKHEVLLSEAQISVEQEKENKLPDTEIQTTQVEHALAAQVIVCNLKDVSVAVPGVLMEKTSEITEPLINTEVSEQVFKEEVEAATPLVTDYMAETAEEGSRVVMMHVPSVMFADNHSIQVQVVDVTITSAETIVDSVLEVGQTEAKEVIDICHETIEKVDNRSATTETEEELTEENKVTIQEVIQHVKDKLPETPPEPINLEQEVIKQSDAVAKMSEMVQSESNEVEDQKETEDSIGAFGERKDEVPAEISDDSSTEKQVSPDLMQTPDIPGSLEVSIHDHKEDLEETKPEKEKSDGITPEVLKLPSEELDVEKIHEQTQISQTAASSIVPTGDSGLVVPQNTGIISSTGNVESPSSLSLEFKLNIQFGQTRAPASLPPTTERTAPVKHKDMSEIGVQAAETEEPVKPINPTQTAESQKQTEVSEAAVQATEIREPTTTLDLTEREVTTSKPVLLNVGIQAMETAEPVEQIKPTDRVTSSVQATPTTQPVRPREKRELFLSLPVHPEAKEKEPVNQIEEENDQDVWMDAEEIIYTQEETEVSLLQVEDNIESQTASEQDEKAGLEHEIEMIPIPKSEEEESQQEMCKTGGTCEIESEDEDFAVALEHPETASVTTLEGD